MTTVPVDAVNLKIFNILQPRPKISKDLGEILNSATDAFKAKSYKIAAKYFQNAVDFMTKDAKNIDERIIILTKYMLCSCWLESKDSKDLFDALKILDTLEKYHGHNYPMLYYALGRAYLNLYWFKKADEVLKKGFAAFRNDDIKFVEYCIPGSNEAIPESSRIGLVTLLSALNDQCSGWRRPDAVCCLAECSTIGHTEGSDKYIFFGSPTFTGMVQVTCNNSSNFCTMCFHIACWKAKKEFLCSPRKISDKEVLHVECFTPNCIDERGEHCIIKKIEIFNDKAEVKATIGGDDAVKHTKLVPPPKGAIKKQQQQSKIKVSSETRTSFVRNPRPPMPPKEVISKVDEIDEEEDLHDEQTLKEGIEKLKILRNMNFGLSIDETWRPDLPMYGSEYMLMTSEALHDPDFSKDCPEDQENKAFIFSYFYELIRNNGPMKLERLEETWKEAQEITIGRNCESIIKHYAHITEFLLQSLKFTIIGNYICIVEKLSEAYDLAKADACEILKFFMDHDIDENSTTSSLDDEAIFNEIINQEKNNNSLSYTTIPKDNFNEESSEINVSMRSDKNNENESTNISDETKMSEEQEKCLGFKKNDNTPTEISETTSTPNCNVFLENNNELVTQSFIANEKFGWPLKKNVEKCSQSTNLIKNNDREKSLENNGFEIPKEYYLDIDDFVGDPLPKYTINGVHNVCDIENQSRFNRSALESEKFSKETKSINNVDNHVGLIDDIREILQIDNSGKSDEHLTTIEFVPNRTTENNPEMIKSKTDNISESKNETGILVSEFAAEVFKLSQELARLKNESEQLKVELAQVKKENMMSKERMLKKILHGQYVYNQSIVTSKLNNALSDYNFIMGIQQILGPLTGQTLFVNQQELLKFISRLENIQNIHETKYAKLNERLCASLKSENPKELDFEPMEIPKFPKYNMTEVIRLAFEKFRLYYTTELQKMLVSPHSNQQTPQPLFGSQHGQNLDYQTHFVNNNSRNVYQGPQQSPVRTMTNHQTIQTQQYVIPPLFPNPTVAPQIYYGPANPPLNPNGYTRETFFPSPLPKNSASPFSKTANNFSAAFQPNFSFPVGKFEQPIAKITQENVPTQDRSNKEQTKINSDPRKDNKSLKKNGHSFDKLMKRLRSHYIGVLELDLLKSVECVRKKHNDSLSNLPILQIIREADKFIASYQKKQLCGYERHQTNQSFAVLKSNFWSAAEDERKRQNSFSSTSSVTSSKKELCGPSGSKKQWEPVNIPNETWIKETEESECIICFESMMNVDTFTLPCKHAFHKMCIQNWYKHQSLGERFMGSCPMCRLNSTIDEEYPPLP